MYHMIKGLSHYAVFLRSRVGLSLVAAIILFSSAGFRVSAQSPQVFLMDATRLMELKRKVKQQDAPTLQLVHRLQAQADKLLDMPPVSVMSKSTTPVSGNKHDYMSQAPYSWYDSTKPNGLPYINRDGQRNPEIYSITDRRYIGELDNACRVLALTWYLTGDEKYAAKAATLLQRWFIDDSSRMNPNLEYAQAVPGVNTGRGIGIIETIALTGIADAAGLLQGSGSWTAADADALRQWYRQYLDWMLTSKNGKAEHAAKNNHGVWYLVQATDFALFTGDKTKARELAEEGKRQIDSQVEKDGRMPLELARTTALWYSTYNLQAWFRLATLAGMTGVDLWSYTNPQGASIRTALDWLRPFALGEKKWDYQQISEYKQGEFYPLLLQAGAKYKDPSYAGYVRSAGKGNDDLMTELLYGN
jgi:Alginate lyase